MKRDSTSSLREGKEALSEIRRLRVEAAQLQAASRQAREHLAWLVEEVKRQWQADYFQQMQAGIRRLHGCESRHVASFAVRKVAEGQTVWEGRVEEFYLIGCRAAKICYAWYYQDENRKQTFSVLKKPPVNSPQSAVQLALAARNLVPLVEC